MMRLLRLWHREIRAVLWGLRCRYKCDAMFVGQLCSREVGHAGDHWQVPERPWAP